MGVHSRILLLKRFRAKRHREERLAAVIDAFATAKRDEGAFVKSGVRVML